MLSIRRSDFTELKEMSLGQIACLLYNDERVEKDGVVNSKFFEDVVNLSCTE